MSAKRLEELEKAHERLSALVNAVVLVAMDSTSSDVLRDAAAAHGVVIITAEDLERRCILALAQVKANIGALTGVVP